MAVAKVKRIDIFFRDVLKEELLEELQGLGVIQIIREEKKTLRKEEPGYNLTALNEAIDYLGRFIENKGLFPSRPLYTKKDVEEILSQENLKTVLDSLSEAKEKIKLRQGRIDRLNHTKEILLPWEKLKIRLKDITPTRLTEPFVFAVDKKRLPNIREDLKKDRVNAHLEVINERDNHAYIFIVIAKGDKEKVCSVLKKNHFIHLVLPDMNGTAMDAILDIDKEISQSIGEITSVYGDIKSLIPERVKLMILSDKLFNDNARRDIGAGLFGTDTVSLLSGWIKEKDMPLLNKRIEKFSFVQVLSRDPKENEEPPVILENKRLIKPFEFITNIYGMPKYNEIDPTPFLAPFFFLYFGFCVSDAGYGLLLMAICLFALKKFRMGPSGTNFFRLFFFGGISTVLIGAITGSWFGNMIDVFADKAPLFATLKGLKDAIILIDPLKEPTKLLGIALFCGIVQVWFGIILAAFGNIRNKAYLDIALDQIPILTLLFGLTGVGLTFLKLMNGRYMGIFSYVVMAASAALILTQGRSEKGIGAKLFFGVYNLYNNLSGYLSDTLSYSRLWALCLVTGVMASTVNLIAIQFSGLAVSMVPFIENIRILRFLVGGVVLIIILIFGHLFSFLMNLLGAFVHPVRLQFVEFFSKFFKSGGSSFKPFKFSTKYVDIR